MCYLWGKHKPIELGWLLSRIVIVIVIYHRHNLYRGKTSCLGSYSIGHAGYTSNLCSWISLHVQCKDGPISVLVTHAKAWDTTWNNEKITYRERAMQLYHSTCILHFTQVPWHTQLCYRTTWSMPVSSKSSCRTDLPLTGSSVLAGRSTLLPAWCFTLISLISLRVKTTPRSTLSVHIPAD
jgi:hypothetical protein